MLWVDSKCFSKTVFFLKIWWASAYFDRSILFFDRSKIFKFDKESLCLFRSIETDFRSIELVSNCFYRVSVCFDRSRLFFDRSKLVKHVFLKDRLDFSKSLFQKVFQFFSLSDLAKAPPSIFVVFLQDFCKVFVLEGR